MYYFLSKSTNFGKYMKITTVLYLCLTFSFLLSCEDKIETPLTFKDDPSKSAMKASLKEIQSQVFDNKCATSGCHVINETFPNLSNGLSYASLVGVMSPGYEEILVKPGEADKSVLIKKLIGNSTMYGKLMPSVSSGFSAVPQAQIDSIKAWINNGAKNN